MGRFVQPDHQPNDIPNNTGVQHSEDQRTATPNNTPKTGIEMETIPPSAVCTFVGEGAANVVFELSGVEDHPGLHGQLLRLPKDESNGPTYAELQAYWQDRVSPLFKPHELVQQRLVKLPQEPAFFDRLNLQLHEIEEKNKRRRDFAGQRFVAEAMNTGMLVEDMRPRKAGAPRPASRPSSSGAAKAKAKGKAKAEEEPDDSSSEDEEDLFTLHEIKPKWLHQSPRAPDGAEQCRNCAREVQRNIKNGSRNPVFCPLNLVKATDFPRNQNVAVDIRNGLRLTSSEADNLKKWLHDSDLLRRLRTKQWDLDHCPKKVVPPALESGGSSSGGASAATSATTVAQSSGAEEDAEEDNVARYCLAMTLRDCSLFLRIPRLPVAEGGEVVAKLADLDKKNYGTKHEYWEGMEDDLHEQNLYSRKGANGLSGKLTNCQLPFYKANFKNLDDQVRAYYRLPLRQPPGGAQSSN
ncbi:hypothetical protein KVR01_004686 [Diaporthe batatas]|uniref:uncharacterized protein n=1 Tax=Diaporthe batatas TaxID=748121 RepID=UPI001D04714C|nr:uncharacterized protein KVR01_004686 [Diaporthe batatas]KAG8166134.1 hypothetical protein KVR01_004686 [Diaporthe batatas]